MRALAAFVAALPWRALAWLGAALGFVAGSVCRVRRAHVEHAMRRAGVVNARASARAMYASLGRAAFEFLWLAGRARPLDGVARIDDASRVRWRSARARGKGVVIAASHTGNWDLAACAMATDGEIVIVTKRLRVRTLDRFWQRVRARRGVRLTEARGALSCGRDALARGASVAMMIDQVPASRSHGIELDFLGARALADRAPATLAARSGAPLVVAASRREASGVHTLSVLEVLLPPPDAGRAWIDDATIRATRALELFVLEHPTQWLWLHRRWRIDASRTRGSRPR